ncbi:MFS family permease [Streptomyces sp. SLBN-8D4]|jgi:MFS family permease
MSAFRTPRPVCVFLFPAPLDGRNPRYGVGGRPPGGTPSQPGPMTTTTRHLNPSRWLALGALLLGEAMNLLDANVVQVAAPAIHADLGGAVSDVQWFGAACTLPFAVLLVTGGRLGDILGRRRLFVAGVAAFTLASVACALAPAVGALIAFRAVQGAAATVIVPQAIGLIKTMFAGPEMSRALGCIGPVMGLAAVCGPVLGGVLTRADLFGSSWRAVFLVNVPLALVVLRLARELPEDRAPVRPTLDVPGTLLAMTGTALVVLPLIGSGLSPRSWATIVTGVAVLIAFVLHQRHVAATGRTALVEPGLFAHRAFPAALVASTAFFAVTNGLMTVVVLQLQLGLGIGVLPSGLTLAPWSLGLAAASWAAGAHGVRRWGRRVMYAGLGVLPAGLCGGCTASTGSCAGPGSPAWCSVGSARAPCAGSRAAPPTRQAPNSARSPMCWAFCRTATEGTATATRAAARWSTAPPNSSRP